CDAVCSYSFIMRRLCQHLKVIYIKRLHQFINPKLRQHAPK
ncbi:MAG: hypothetical protein ACI9K8_000868, partial [Reinekea sp.]